MRRHYFPCRHSTAIAVALLLTILAAPVETAEIARPYKARIVTPGARC